MTNAQVVTPISATIRVEHAQTSAIKYAQAGVLSAEARDEIILALDGVDLPMYEGVRAAWVSQYRVQREASEEAGAKAWERFCKEFAIEKPKATSAKAVEMAEKREAEKTARQALPLAKVIAAKEAAIKAAQTAQAASDFKAATKANAEAATLQAELVRRQKDADKGKIDALNAKRKAIAKRLETANLETLNKIEALLDSIQSNATTEAIAKLIHAVKPEAAAKPAKARKAA